MSTASHSRKLEAEGIDDAWKGGDNSGKTEQALNRDTQWR